jgi:signal transduction histidine kinase
VIRRSVAYAVLWLLISGGYVAAALAFGIAVGGRVPLALAIALTIGATLFAAPVRRRLERMADRLVFGRRVSGYELLARLGSRLQAAPGAEDVAATVAADVRAGLDARWVRVVLEERGRAVAGAAGRPDEGAGPVLSVPLVRGTLTVGAIECGPPREGRYSDSDRQLLATLGEQAALAVHNSWLTAQLASRLDELTASRARIIHAEDTGRRRLERDIHDGVQQELVALLARLGLARNQLRRDVALAEASLAEVQRDAQRALVSLQELARGIHPPLLSDRGLLEAVRARTARLPLPVTVTSAGLDGRLPAGVEGAAYFVIVEALGNVLKHAGAEHAGVDLVREGDRLQIAVHDDGKGFDVDAADRHGLLGLQDRVEALGGTMSVTSAPRRGTTVLVTIPGGPDDQR